MTRQRLRVGDDITGTESRPRQTDTACDESAEHSPVVTMEEVLSPMPVNEETHLRDKSRYRNDKRRCAFKELLNSTRFTQKDYRASADKENRVTTSRGDSAPGVSFIHRHWC
jgi:hypothetical protein